MTMLVKTLPFYIKWNQETTVKDLLQASKQQLMGSMSNSLFSFAEIKAMNNAINSHILFAYQDDLKPSDSALFTHQPLMENATGENLAFEIIRNNNKLVLHTEYHSNEYTQSYIQRLMHCYDTILKGFLNSESENKRLCELPILTDEEQQTILSLGTGEHLDYDQTETIVDLFHRQVQLTPKNIAVVDEVSEITYAELDRKSDLLATTLRKKGVNTDTFVAIMLPRRKEFLIAIFAVFKAGGAYIPLDSDYPKERLSMMLKDSDAHILITTAALLKNRQTEQYFPREKHLLMDDFYFNDPLDYPVNFAQPSGLAYMIYTSGTTGRPKGVMIDHKNLRAFLEYRTNLLHLTQEERCAQHASFSFDASLDDLLSPLVKGAQVHILSSELRHDIEGMKDYFIRNKITGLTLSTQLGIEILSNSILTLRYLMLGGSKMQHIPTGNTKVINGYGPTEFTVCSSYYILNQNEKYNNIPIGKPVPNSISVVVDHEGRLIPQGTVGELCLIGRQMSRGYWKQEELTKERFVDCSFLSDQKMYRTGDLVRWNEDGLLEYIGRIDNQVKLHGYRIELEEIENKISHCSGVISTVVVVHKQGNVEFLVAFYTSENNKELPDIQKALREDLPSFMVPSQFIRIDQMPKTPNGKIDRQQLNESVSKLLDTTDTLIEPSNQKEQILLDLVKEILRIDNIGVTNDLTLLGLSSLDAIKLSSLAGRKGMKLMVNDILNNKTIRNIACHELSLGRWLNKYDPDKPIVIAIQGFSPYQVHNYFEALREKYSVFMFASIDDYFDQEYRNLTKSDVIAKYVQMLHDMLPINAVPYAFTGHCYGGELAYRCAAQWQVETGQSPKVFVLNTPLRTDEEVRQMMPSQSIIEQMPPERQQKLFDWEKQQKRVMALLDGQPMPSFKGDVVFYRAMHPFLAVNKLTLDIEAFNRQVEIYLQRWKELQPQMKIIPIPTDHFTMLESEYSKLYMKEL